MPRQVLFSAFPRVYMSIGDIFAFYHESHDNSTHLGINVSFQWMVLSMYIHCVYCMSYLIIIKHYDLPLPISTRSKQQRSQRGSNCWMPILMSLWAAFWKIQMPSISDRTDCQFLNNHSHVSKIHHPPHSELLSKCWLERVWWIQKRGISCSLSWRKKQ